MQFVELVANLANSSAFSLPIIPVCPGTQIRSIVAFLSLIFLEAIIDLI